MNADRIDRFFAHEYTHVLRKIRPEDRRLKLESPLERALWRCLTKGLGDLPAGRPREKAAGQARHTVVGDAVSRCRYLVRTVEVPSLSPSGSWLSPAS
jgi:hypothetical protein